MDRLSVFAADFNRRLEAVLLRGLDVPALLRESACYSALSPGKRIRPFLVVACCDVCGDRTAAAWAAAAAVECIHTFSLIHDDLPAMDDDDWRRGRPTCHKKFGEAMAILAGDALVALAFEVLASQEGDPIFTGRLVLELAQGTGWEGMIGGQAADLLGESRPPTITLTQSIHDRKTARLFRTACRLGAIAGGADEAKVSCLGRYGEKLGRAFQIADDLLDVATVSGEPKGRQGSDERKNKQTYPACLGMEQSRQAALTIAEEAILELDGFGEGAEVLRELCRYVVNRDF